MSYHLKHRPDRLISITHGSFQNQTLINRVLSYVTAASTFTGGVLHLAIIPMFFAFTPVNVMIFFLVSGAGQLFWVIPVLKRWSNVWYYIGVGGTAILIALFVIAVPARGQKEQRRLKWSQVESPRAIDIMGISSMYGSNTSRSLDTLATKITSDPSL